MSIKSYLAYPAKDRKLVLESKLRELPGCTVLTAENKDLLVLVTDTVGEEQEETLMSSIRNLEELDHIALVSGFDD